VWKEVKPVCVELIVPFCAGLKRELRDLDARLWCSACRSIDAERGGVAMGGSGAHVSASPSTLGTGQGAAGRVSSTRMISADPETPSASSNTGVPLSCRPLSSSDPLTTRAGTWLDIQRRSSLGVSGVLDREFEGGTSSVIKRRAVLSGTATPSELRTRSVLFPTTTRQ
jgi:hypothetical protein